MPGPRALRGLCLLALGAPVLALRGTDRQLQPFMDKVLVAAATSEQRDGRQCTPKGAWRQELRNNYDVQYTGEVIVGGQPVRGIIDTGSFEIVLFSAGCRTCGQAAAFNQKISRSWHRGKLEQVHAYGSGSCNAQDGSDRVQIGCFTGDSQSMWLAVDCQMPLLQHANFNAIVGIGPPGQPELTAKASVKRLEDQEAQYKALGVDVPKSVGVQLQKVKMELQEATKKTSMLSSFGISTFSACFGSAKGSPAWIIWNDVTREGQQGVARIPVAGNITWSVRMEDLHLVRETGSGGAAVQIGCGAGCGAIIDTGTSLLAVPTSVYMAISQAINNDPMIDEDCGDVSSFPDLEFEIGDLTVRLPPSSYIGSLYGDMPAAAAKYLHLDKINSRGNGPPSGCHLLLMDMGEENTQFGPMIVLGVPFFREYYTTFSLGNEGPAGLDAREPNRSPGRAIYVSRSNEQCEPDLQGASQMHARRQGLKGMRLDASKLQVPRWAPGAGVAL